MGPTVAITGASGFLGGALLARLRAADVRVTGYARQEAAGLVTVRSYDEVEAADVILHCAEISNAAVVAEAGEDYRAEALATTRTLLGRAARVLYMSSAIVYGDGPARGRRTDEAVVAHHPYARIKLDCEALVADRGGTALRLANICGKNQPFGTVLADILAQLSVSGPLVLRNIAAVRDFLWLDDATRAIALAIEAPHLPGIINLGSGSGVSVGEFAVRILAVAGQPGRAIISSAEPREACLWLDIAETSRLLNWMPEISIEQGAMTLLDLE